MRLVRSRVADHILQLTGRVADREHLSELTYMAMNHDPDIVAVDTVRGYYVGSKILVEVCRHASLHVHTYASRTFHFSSPCLVSRPLLLCVVNSMPWPRVTAARCGVAAKHAVAQGARHWRKLAEGY